VKLCWLCKRDPKDSSVLIVLHDGRLVEVCDLCLEKADRDEPYCEPLDYTEGAA
jgi:hypothetical protein